MGKVRLSFTLNGRKNTYLRRIDMYGKPLTTTNINSARKFKDTEVKGIVKLLMKEWGKNGIKDLNVLKDEA